MDTSKLILGSGLFLGTWTMDVTTRKLYAASGIADFLGVPRHVARNGAPSEVFDRTVVSDDLEQLKKSVKIAIHNGSKLALFYRVETPRFGRQLVFAKGRCYRLGGEPAFLTGHTVCFHDVGRADTPEHVLAHCDAILSLANGEQANLLRYFVEMARDEAARLRKADLLPIAVQGSYTRRALKREQNISAVYRVE